MFQARPLKQTNGVWAVNHIPISPHRSEQKGCQFISAEAVPAIKTAAIHNMAKNNHTQKTSTSDPTLAGQIAANRTRLALMNKFANQEEVQVDFIFSAPNAKAAEALVGQLEMDPIHITYISRVFDRQGVCTVEARTNPMPLSVEVMDPCVTRMVNYAGQQACNFDGWGTLVSAE